MRAGFSGERAAVAGALLLCVLHAAGCDRPERRDVPFRAVATVDDLMDGIVIPASETLFDAVVYADGELVQSPVTDDDWHRVRVQALALAEAGNLLLMPPRVRDGEWATYSIAMTDSAQAAAAAAEAHDAQQLLVAGSAVYSACTGCHQAYVPAD